MLNETGHPQAAPVQEPPGEGGSGWLDQISCSRRPAAWLRKAGLRVTASRTGVIRALVSSQGRWLSPEQIYRGLGGASRGTSLASIYNAIRRLESSRIVLREFHNGANGAQMVYQLDPRLFRGAFGTPVFVICRQCNDSRLLAEPLPCQLHRIADQPRPAAERHLSIYMTCERCASRDV